ncbi:MAG: GNAT family N-acetyltransferase [Myxococcota bacterium]
MDREEAVALLRRAPVVHLASVTTEGEPILRTVHGVVVGNAVAFHGAPAGEKMEAVGRRAVISAEEHVAQIPSYFLDPERACPATTYYRSAQVHGVLERVDDANEKAEVLSALMQRFQPEGGHVPIDAAHPLYRKAVAGIMVLKVRLDDVDGKAKLGQNRRPEELHKVMLGLWRRGASADLTAMELVRAANPECPPPEFLRGPDGVSLHVALRDDDVAQVVALLHDVYWTVGIPGDALARSHRGAAAWVGARDGKGQLVATARAISDGARSAWIHDVMVAPAWRGKGVGSALLALLLDHPAVRHAREVRLQTRDAMALYARFGFVERGRNSERVEMVRLGA